MKTDTSPIPPSSTSLRTRFANLVYRYRWPVAAATLVLIAGVAGAGAGRIADFTRGVVSLDHPDDRDQAAARGPRLFDARYDIWFDPEDSGLATYNDIEAQFLAEDTVVIGFSEPDDPWGIFSPRALATIDRLTEEIAKVPNVRHVRSLTASPWVRWGRAGPDEEGLIVTDLFEEDPERYSERERLERMIAVLGASRAAAIVGDDAVRAVLGVDADYADHLGEPRLIGGVVSEDARSAALQIQLLRPKADDLALADAFGDDDNGRLVAASMHVNESQWAALEAIADITDRDPSGYRFHLAGMPVLERNFMTVGTSDMIYVGLMFAVIALVLLILFRKTSGVVIPLIVVALSVLGMEGLVWLLGDLINNLTAVAPNMITAIGIADAVHLIASYYALQPEHDDKRSLIVAVIEKNAVPVLLTSLTTAVGFFSLVSSEIIPMKMLGYTAGLGTVIAYLVSMTLVPALLSIVPMPRRPRGNAEVTESASGLRRETYPRHWSDRLVPFVLRNRIAIALVSLTVVVVSFVGLARMRVTSDFREMFPDDDPYVVDSDWIESELSGTGDLELVFYGLANDASADDDARRQRIDELLLRSLQGGALAPGERAELAQLQRAESAYQRARIGVAAEFLAEADRFERRLLAEARDSDSPLRIISRVESPLDVLRKMNQVQNGNRAADYRVPTEADVPARARAASVQIDEFTEEAILIPAQSASTLASQYYVQYENGAKPGENLSRMLTADRRGFRISVAIDQADSTLQLAAFERIREIAATEFPILAGGPDAAAEMTMTGKLYLFANMIDRFTRSLAMSLGIAIALITLLIAVTFRSARIGLISIVPNVLPLIVPLGAMGLLGIAIDGPAVLVVSVALGICVDDTIHFFARFYEARRSGATVEQSMAGAFRQVGSALTATTVILVLGFAVMMLSSFRPNLLIGQLAIVMIALAWVADFIVTPAMLSLLAERDPR